MNFQPTSLNERVDSLDILRGFSLLGILLVNIFAFYLPMPHVDLGNWFTEAKDIIWHQTLDIYVQSSFYPLFSMLFGYGMAMQFMKAKQTGSNFYKFSSKRLIIILIIGLIHAFFIWWGDILTMYAFCGFFLILFLRFGSGWLLTFAFVINGLMQLFFIGIFALSGMANMEVEPLAVDIQTINNAITAYGIGSWTDAFVQRLKDLSVQMSIAMWISALMTILPYMLIGAAAAKWRLVERSKELKGFWLILTIICLTAGLFVKSAPYLFGRTYLLDYLKVYVGGPILAIGYTSAILCLCMVPVVRKILKPIAKAGRMSLTIYIMQSIILSIIFYNFGFGLYGEVDVPMGTMIALALFVIQVIFAELWFTRFKQGPLEWAVKKLTYRNLSSEK
ncbi:DUF418 domain-containing protein [Lysinibacillus yapensis]|uniref:DUF418 domain-containing protein n=1 Tax=Ureibacillus yapensis TaxID=2304605 RepID=A0A396SEX7_9BACL|nr:DUF418 domain-containing protein [Lysinibacillus yapensis]RHW39884.1 DUF418 domain-containing protein [Lysinibacillus yapensis]